jgi:hypothetical protein
LEKYTPKTFFKNLASQGFIAAVEEDIYNSNSIFKYGTPILFGGTSYLFGPENNFYLSATMGAFTGIGVHVEKGLKRLISNRKSDKADKSLSDLAEYYSAKNN